MQEINEMQQMPRQFIDLGFKHYSKNLDLQLYLMLTTNLMRFMTRKFGSSFL